MVTETGNFECSRCGEPILHADLGQATVQLTERGIVMVCSGCIGSSSKPAVVLVGVKVKS